MTKLHKKKWQKIGGYISCLLVASLIGYALLCIFSRNTAAGGFTGATGSGSLAELPNRVAELQAAQHANPDTVAWITVPGTNIDGPVQQSIDNDYYMRRDERGQPSHEGCFFADYECSFDAADTISPNTVIYGHTFSRPEQDPNTGFGQLVQLTEPTFSAEHPTLYLTLPNQTLAFDIISVGYADEAADQVCIKAYPTSREWNSIYESAKTRNLLDLPFDFKTGDKLLTLSTCTSDADTRLLVVAKLTK